jgi:predicted MFS family arabinose efflux permease
VRVYAQILRTPGVAAIVASTLLGRMPIGISGLAILLYVEEVSDSYAAAGICAGALALGSAAGAPFQGRIVDRRGVGALLVLATAHAAGLVAIWLAGEAGAAVALLAVVSLVTGATLPPLSSVLRSRWPYLLPDRPDLIAGAFALDSVLIEFAFVVGPLVTTIVVATVGSQYALIVSAACVLLGTAMMLAGLRRKPGPERADAGSSAFGLGALASPGLRTLVLASLPVGFTFGTLEVVLPAFSEAEGSKALAGLLLAVWSAASAAGGLVWGARGGSTPLLRAHMIFAWALPVCVAPLLLAVSPLTMALLTILTGLPMAPLIASRNQLVKRVALPGTTTEAFTWPLTSLVGGISLGAAVAGAVVEASSWSGAVVMAMTVAVGGAAVVSWRRRTLAPPLAVSG